MLWFSLALLVAFVNSLYREGTRGVQQGWDLGEGRECGVETSIMVVRVLREEENHRSS